MPSNPTIWTLTLPSGTTYEIEDRYARQFMAGGIHLIGETNTPIVDGASTPTAVLLIGDEEPHTMVANEAVFQGSKEFVWTGLKWVEWGDLTGLGTLATQDSASGNYTPEGTIQVNAASGNGTSYTPEGDVSTPTITLKTAGQTASVTPFGSAGTLPSLSMTVQNGNLTIGFDQGTLPSGGSAVTVKTGDAEYESDTPTFTGTEKKLAFSGTQDTITVS